MYFASVLSFTKQTVFALISLYVNTREKKTDIEPDCFRAAIYLRAGRRSYTRHYVPKRVSRS